MFTYLNLVLVHNKTFSNVPVCLVLGARHFNSGWQSSLQITYRYASLNIWWKTAGNRFRNSGYCVLEMVVPSWLRLWWYGSNPWIQMNPASWPKSGLVQIFPDCQKIVTPKKKKQWLTRYRYFRRILLFYFLRVTVKWWTSLFWVVFACFSGDGQCRGESCGSDYDLGVRFHF